MISSGTSSGATGPDRAAASARLLRAAPFGPVTRLRRSGGELSTMKINNFEFPSVPGSIFWRPPA